MSDTMSDLDNKKETHESYGLLRFSRQQGGHYNLFGSAVKHNNTIELVICEGRHVIDYAEDRYYAGRELVSIRLSPVQFAEAISSLNAGSGIPCTIEHIDGDKGSHREPCPAGTNQRETIQDYHKEIVNDLTKQLSSLGNKIVETLDKPKLGKKDKEDIVDQFQNFLAHFKSNLPFVLTQFNRSVDKTLNQAKGELDACVTNTIAMLGMQKLNEILGGPTLEVPLLEGSVVESNEA